MEVLITSSKGRADPADIKLLDLIDSNNYKQASADIDKRLKKAKNDKILTNKLLVNKAIVSFKNGNRKQPFEVLSEVVKDDSAWREKDILIALDHFAHLNICTTELASQVLALWDRALKTLPNDEKSCAELFEAKFLSHDYSLAQKIAKTRAKTSRHWRILWLISLHLSSYSPLSLESNKKILGDLACRILSTDAENALKNEDYVRGITSHERNEETGPTPSKKVDVLCGTREIELLFEVHRRHGKQEEAASTFNRIRHTLTGEANHVFIKTQMQMLQDAGRWDDFWDEGEKYLVWGKSTLEDVANPEHARQFETYAGDWTLWKSMAFATTKMSHDKQASKQALLVGLLADVQPEDQQLNHLLTIYLETLKADVEGEDNDNVGGLCADYLSSNAESPMGFSGLKAVAPNVGPTGVAFLLGKAQDEAKKNIDSPSRSKNPQKAWLLTEINSLKQDYYRVVSAGSNVKNAALLNAFTATCLRLWKVSLIASRANPSEFAVKNGSTQLGDTAALLAVMALTHLWYDAGRSLMAPIRITLILERLLAHSPHNNGARLYAIRVHLFLGNPNRAISIFRQLDVKNLQNLSTAWILITRLSTIDPIGAFDVLQEVYNGVKGILSSSSKATRAFLQNSSWLTLLQELDVFEIADHSIAAWLAWIELAQCASLLRKDMPARRGRRLPLKSMKDYREEHTFPNFEASGGSLDRLWECGSHVSNTWIMTQLQAASMRQVISGTGIPESVFDAEQLWGQEALDKQRNHVILELKSGSAVLTDAEMGRMVFCQKLQLILSHHYSLSSQLDSHSVLSELHGEVSSCMELLTEELRERCEQQDMFCEYFKSTRVKVHLIGFVDFHRNYVLFDKINVLKAFLTSLKLQQHETKQWIGPGTDHSDSHWYVDQVDSSMREINMLLERLASGVRLQVEQFKDSRVVDAYLVRLLKVGIHEGEAEVVELLFDESDPIVGLTAKKQLLNVLAGWRESLSNVAKVADICRQ